MMNEKRYIGRCVCLFADIVRHAQIKPSDPVKLEKGVEIQRSSKPSLHMSKMHPAKAEWVSRLSAYLPSLTPASFLRGTLPDALEMANRTPVYRCRILPYCSPKAHFAHATLFPGDHSPRVFLIQRHHHRTIACSRATLTKLSIPFARILGFNVFVPMR